MQQIGMINVIGIGLDGASGLPEITRNLVMESSLLVGSDRHLNYFPNYSKERIVLDNFKEVFDKINRCLYIEKITVLVSGDPLFFGFGRLLLSEFSAEKITFYPHVSSIQLAFNRIKIPWQDSHLVSVHGRSLDELTQALQQGSEKIAILTDGKNTPTEIARLLVALDLPSTYKFWVCENLGGEDEQVQCYDLPTLTKDSPPIFSPLNVVVLVRKSQPESIDLNSLPKLGLPDSCFLSFPDRPGLMTKREVRLLVLGELGLQGGQTIWDIGAGTGSVSIEIARLFPDSQIYAIEKTTMGASLIEQNCRRFQVENITIEQAAAPDGLAKLPKPDRIFIGGSGGNLPDILQICDDRLREDGAIVLALATLEHLHTALHWMNDRGWQSRLLQVQISRSVPVASLTRFSPLNPVTILTATRY